MPKCEIPPTWTKVNKHKCGITNYYVCNDDKCSILDWANSHDFSNGTRSHDGKHCPILDKEKL